VAYSGTEKLWMVKLLVERAMAEGIITKNKEHGIPGRAFCLVHEAGVEAA
jgi:hypothetical protein